MVWRDMEGHGLQEICFNHRVEARCSVLLLIDGAHFYSSKYRLKADFFLYIWCIFLVMHLILKQSFDLVS